MQFHYTASESSGRVVNGEIEAQSPAAVLEWMVQRGMKPISIKAATMESKKLFGKSKGRRINIEDQVFLTKYLALMLRVGTDLFRAIDILIADFDKPAMKSLLVEMKDTLSKGQPFYATFSRYPKYFSPVFVSLIKAGEASGSLEAVLTKLSTDLEKQWDLRNKIRGSLIYPIFLIGLSTVVLFLMVSFALPKIAETFSIGAIEPPLFSKIVFSIGFFFSDFMIPIAIGMIGLVVGGFFFFTKSVTGKRFVSVLGSKVPVVRNVTRKIALQRFASTLSSLIHSGIPILEALDVTADAVGPGELRDALVRISKEGLVRGLTVGEAFRKEQYFPRVIVNLIAISEQSGNLEEVLGTLADFYESEIDASVKGLVSFIEPALLIGIGAIVGLLTVSIIVPVYQLVGQI